MAKKFVEGFSEETEDMYDCRSGYCNGPFVNVIDKKTKKLVPLSKLPTLFTNSSVKVRLDPNNHAVRPQDPSIDNPVQFKGMTEDYLDKTYNTKRLKYKPSYQAGGMLKGMPHEAGGQVLVDEQGNPMAEAEGGEIIFSVEVSSMIDEATNAYMQAKSEKDRDALALEVGRMVLEERMAQMQNESEEAMMGGNMGEEEMAMQGGMEGGMQEGMQGAMQKGGRLRSKMIEKRLALINEF